MSIRIKARLSALFIVTTHDERQEIDREVERRTKQECDKGIDRLSDDELRAIVGYIRNRRRPFTKTMMEAIA